MTYFGRDLKDISPPPEPRASLDVGAHIVGGFLVAVILLILGGYIS